MSNLNIVERINENKDLNHCWQYQMRLDHLAEDLTNDGLTIDEVSNLRISDFTFSPIDYKNKSEKFKVDNFINRHEWLQKMPQRVTHVFGSFYKDILVGVIVMATPNAFSNMLGENTKNIEKLISRGACKSWTPKNMASWIVMKSINWMVQNTQFRLFSAYSDSEAKELGTIYQACNFIYVGKTSGGTIQLFDPDAPNKGWFSDREIRKTSMQRRILKKLGIKIEKEWLENNEFKISKVPLEIRELIKAEQKIYSDKCLKRNLPKKHKYVYILGKSKKETKRLLKVFIENKNKALPYPKER